MNEAKLIQGRDSLLEAFATLFSGDPDVVGLFVGGSVAAGNADAWSDIDLRVLVPDDKHASFVSRRGEMPQRIDGFLFNEWLPGAIHCISHFQGFVKVDVFYLSAAEFEPSPWYGRPIKILHDPKGLIRDVVDRSKNLTFETDIEDVERSAGKGVAAIHEAYRQLQRSELVFAQSLLDELRQHMVFADDWIASRPPQAVPFSRLRSRGSEPLLRVFQSSFGPLEAATIQSALASLALHYRDQLSQLAAQTSAPLTSHIHAIALVTDQIGTRP